MADYCWMIVTLSFTDQKGRSLQPLICMSLFIVNALGKK